MNMNIIYKINKQTKQTNDNNVLTNFVTQDEFPISSGFGFVSDLSLPSELLLEFSSSSTSRYKVACDCRNRCIT